jgi:hypothetical protein
MTLERQQDNGNPFDFSWSIQPKGSTMFTSKTTRLTRSSRYIILECIQQHKGNESLLLLVRIQYYASCVISTMVVQSKKHSVDFRLSSANIKAFNL